MASVLSRRWRSAISAILRRLPERPLATSGEKKRDSISGATASWSSLLPSRVLAADSERRDSGSRGLGARLRASLPASEIWSSASSGASS